MRWVS